MAESVIYIDGKFYPKSEAKISVFDHGLLYGDGVFEGIRAYHGQVFLCREHIDRIFEGAHSLTLKIPCTKGELRDVLYESLKQNNLTDAYIRLIVTRGVGDLGLSPSKCAEYGTVICIAASISLYPEELYQKGLTVVTASTVRAHPESLNPRVKSLNYLSNILAKLEGMNAGCEEAVMLNHRGEVCECTGDNIFIVKKGVLITTPPSAVILEGCTRNCVIELARQSGVTVVERPLARYDLYNADEFFLTGTAAELIPVTCMDGRKIGSGSAGKVTLDLLQKFRRFAAEYKDGGVD
jgi:branched-chain amino acid aminotransferase